MVKLVPWQTIFDDNDPLFWKIFNSPEPVSLPSEDKETGENSKEQQ